MPCFEPLAGRKARGAGTAGAQDGALGPRPTWPSAGLIPGGRGPWWGAFGKPGLRSCSLPDLPGRLATGRLGPKQQNDLCSPRVLPMSVQALAPTQPSGAGESNMNTCICSNGVKTLMRCFKRVLGVLIRERTGIREGCPGALTVL